MDKCVSCGKDIPEGYGHICSECQRTAELDDREDLMWLYLLCHYDDKERNTIL